MFRFSMLTAAVAGAVVATVLPGSAHAVVPVRDDVTVVETYEGYPGTFLVASCTVSGTAPGTASVSGTATMSSPQFSLNFISSTCTVRQPLANPWSVSNTQSGNSVSVNGSGQLLVPTPPTVCVSGRFQLVGTSYIDHYGTDNCL